MLIPMNKLDLIKAKGNPDNKHKLPDGGIWRMVRGHRVYIVDGQIVAGHVPGVTDKADFKKLVKQEHAEATKTKETAPKKTTKKTSEAKPDKKPKTTKTKEAAPKKPPEVIIPEKAKKKAPVKKAPKLESVDNLTFINKPVEKPQPLSYESEFQNNGRVRIIAKQTGTYSVPNMEVKGYEDVVKVFADLADADREKLFVMATKNNKILGIQCVHIGAVDQSIAAPKDMAKLPLLSGADTAYVVHNHPTGISTPSTQDVDVTTKYGEVLETMGINFGGHVVIGDDNYNTLDVFGNVSGFSYGGNTSVERSEEAPMFETYQDRKDDEPTVSITSSSAIFNYLKNNLKINDPDNSVFIIGADTKNRITHAEPIDVSSGIPSVIKRNVMKSLVTANCTNFFISSGKHTADTVANVGLKAITQKLGVRLLDVIKTEKNPYNADGGMALTSILERYGSLDIIKATKTDKGGKVGKDKLPDGGIWRTMHGHKIYIVDGEIVAGHVKGVTDTPEAKKLTKKMYAEARKSDKAVPKTASNKKAPAKKTSEEKKPVAKKTKAQAEAAQAEAAKARKEIDAIANSRPKEPKKKTVKEAMAESKKATDEALKKPNKKLPQGKGASKADLDKLVEKNNKRPKTKPGKGATKADLDKVIAENEANKPKIKPTTKEDLDELFGTGSSTKEKKPKSKAKKEAEVAVIRSEKQENNEIAYDVGKKIGGARKDMAELQAKVDKLVGRHSGQSLEELEKISPETAQKYCVKKNLLPPIDFEAEYKRGTEINVAMAKQLIYDRIVPKPEGDTPEARKFYMEAIRSLTRAIEPIKKWDELRDACRNLGDRMKLEDRKRVHDQQGYIDYAKKQLEKPVTDYDKKKFDYKTNAWVERTEADVMAERQAAYAKQLLTQRMMEEAAKQPYAVLGEKLLNFFTDYESRNRTFDTVYKKKLDWGNYFKQQEAKPASEDGKPQKSNNKTKWEDEKPAEIKRSGGRVSKVEKPEEMIKAFGFSGVEFGNWVDDTSGNFHLKKCAESFLDLADILGIKDKDVSLNGRLSMAFGARGHGFALAHYEPMTKAINITKEGGAGSLAHEWGHALDNILYQESVGRASTNLASNGMGDDGTPEIKAAYKELMHAIKIGDGQGYVEVENKNNIYYSFHPSYKEMVQTVGIKKAIQIASEAIEKRGKSDIDYYERLRGRYDDKTVNSKIKQAQMKLARAKNDMVQEMAYHHEKITGEKLAMIPMFTGNSQYYEDSLAIGGKNSKYWTASEEMFARAFAQYIEGKMRSGKVKNDYLVHGTYYPKGFLAPYPNGTERDKIHAAFDKLMEAVRKSGAIQKGLAVELQKDFASDFKEAYDKAGEGGLFTREYLRKYNQRNRNAYNVTDPSEVFFIPVNRLKCEYQTELALNFDKIRENVERMKNGENLEPVVIGYSYDVHDGHHRIEASKIMSYTHVPCIVGGSNELDVQRAKEAYSEVWKSLIFEQLDPKAFPYEATGLMFRGIGQKEFDFIQERGYIQSKGKGNDADQESVTCFTNLFSQAEGYARSQFDLYNEKHAYVLAVERPVPSEENELGEIEVNGKIPSDMIRGILPVESPKSMVKGLKEDIRDIDLSGEKKAILDYSERIKAIKDPKVRKVIAEIIKDEENHKHNLKQVLAYLNGDTSALDEDKLEK